jgi:RNA polymerase sigma factor (sigma-70 family)
VRALDAEAQGDGVLTGKAPRSTQLEKGRQQKERGQPDAKTYPDGHALPRRPNPVTIGSTAGSVNTRESGEVLFLAPPRALGVSGVDTYLAAVAVRLASCGDRVSLFELRPAPTNASSCQSSGGFRRCRIGYISSADVGRLVESLMPARDDLVIHTHADWLLPLADTLAARWGASLLHTVHYQEPDTVRLLNEHRPSVIAVSAAIARDLRMAGYGGAIEVVHNFADDRWSGKRRIGRMTASLRRRADIPSDAPVVLFAGRANSMLKGADLLVRSFPAIRQRISGVVLGFAGPYWLPPHVQRIANQHAEAIRLFGVLSPIALRAAYATASVVAVPSRYEPFGLVALEAQAMGTPVVASAVGGLPEVVHPGLGRLLPTDSNDTVAPEALAIAIAEVLDRDEPHRQAASDDLLAWATTNFSATDHVARLRATYARQRRGSRRESRHIQGVPRQLMSVRVTDAASTAVAGEQPYDQVAAAFDVDQAAALAREQAAVFATSSAERDEIAGEATARAWTDRQRFDTGRGSLEAWMFGIVRNVARELKRRESREQRVWSRLWGTRSERLEAIEDRVVRVEDVRSAFARLPSREQTVLYLRYWKDLPYDEISRRTGIRTDSCRQLARRGLMRLGRYL